LKPPDPNENGDPVSKATAHMITTSPKEVDALGGSVNDLEQLARAYAKAADAEHAAKLARIMARDRLIECAPIGFECESVRVIKRNCWKLNDEAVAEMTATRAALIENGKAELVATVIAVRIGREDQSWQS
jgi:hypothetical protein